MKYEMKGIKYAAFASQETPCFRASLYRDGKKVGEVSNGGHGGSDMLQFLDGRHAQEATMFEKHCLEWYETQPQSKEACELNDHYRGMCAMESWCGHQLDQYLNERELKRLIKKSVKTGPYWRYVDDKPGEWRHSKPSRGMSVTCMQLAIARWNDKDGGKRVLAEFINDGQHVKL